MVHDLKPYPAYKNSGVPWLGEVPTHWEVLGLKRLATFKSGSGFPIEEQGRQNLEVPFFKVSDMNLYSNDRTLRLCNNTVSRETSARLGATVFPAGAIVFPKVGGAMLTNKRRVVERPCCIDNNLMGCIVRRGDPKFVLLLLQRIDFGTIAKPGPVPAISEGEVREIRIVFPPLPEQAAIVRFLDYAERRIRRYIRSKQKVIRLLEEQKQAMIQSALSREFVEHLPLNVLGLPQQVAPARGWQSVSVGHLIRMRWLAIQDGNHGELHPKASEYVDQGIPFLMAKDVRPQGLDVTRCAKITEERARSLRIGFALPGDVLLTHKASIGQIGRVPDELLWPFVMLTPQVTYYRPLRNQIAPGYLFLYMQSRTFQEQLQVLSLNQSTRPYIGLIEQRNLVLCFPSLVRQWEIANEYEEEARPVNTAIEQSTREVVLLREYRSRLVADVVTGKLDVREAAARIPDEPEEPEVVEEAEVQSNADEDAEAMYEAEE